MLTPPTCLGPELDVFDADRHELGGGVWVPGEHEDLVFVPSGGGQFLSLLPVPDHDTVVVVQANRGQLLAIT